MPCAGPLPNVISDVKGIVQELAASCRAPVIGTTDAGPSSLQATKSLTLEKDNEFVVPMPQTARVAQKPSKAQGHEKLDSPMVPEVALNQGMYH